MVDGIFLIGVEIAEAEVATDAEVAADAIFF
jgi:hypothetical protein